MLFPTCILKTSHPAVDVFYLDQGHDILGVSVDIWTLTVYIINIYAQRIS